MGINKNLYFGTNNAFSFSQYGCYISGDSVYNSPIRVYDEYEIPGRNGNLLVSQNRFANIEVTYPAFIFASSQAEFATKMRDLRNKLYSYKGYQKITDDYHPDEFRLGVYLSGLEASPVHYNRAGEFTVSFNCKPQRFLTSGQTYTNLTHNTNVTLTNPTPFEASPLIFLSSPYYGATFTINGTTITVAASSSDYNLYIDTESGEAYKSDGTSVNSLISIPGNEFPKLASGSNTVKFVRGSSSSTATAKIMPNWWRV